MPQIDFQFYLVCDRKQIGQKTLAAFIEEAAVGGVRAIQFREKDLPLSAQLRLAQQIKPIVRKYGIRLFINDRIDLCHAVEAGGVHLPSEGLPIPVARALLHQDQQLGISCHSVEEVMRAEVEGADFALLGPIYDTPSKRPFGPSLGINTLRRAKTATSSIPLFAVGGVKMKHLPELFAAGADGVSMISEIATASDISEQCRMILHEISRLKRPDSVEA
jgi:thiamine-phosphate pyrophosphorylase